MATTGVSVIEDAISHAVKKGASDIHINAEQQAIIRVNGDLHQAQGPEISDRSIAAWLEKNLDADSLEELDREGDVDFALSRENETRLRISAFHHQGKHALAIRLLQSRIPDFNQLSLPEVMRTWPERQTGLIIVTGPTGSGKSTTLASLVNSANISRAAHIVSIEDPVEFIYPPGVSTIQQREIGLDASGFPRAVRAALREDVDILVLGEMRDAETISAALAVAETGHLVFATLHTPGAPHAIDRIIDAFEPFEQPLIRSRLAASLVGIVYQRLIKATDGGRVAGFEILVGNTAIRNLIREGKTHQIPSMMTTGMNEGMCTMEHYIRQLVAANRVSADEAKRFLAKNV